MTDQEERVLYDTIHAARQKFTLPFALYLSKVSFVRLRDDLGRGLDGKFVFTEVPVFYDDTIPVGEIHARLFPTQEGDLK